ncbi:hypothetical protein METHPM2_270032 [Pseudomonas sp. PM2]
MRYYEVRSPKPAAQVASSKTPPVGTALDLTQGAIGGRIEAQHRPGIASNGSHKGDRVWMIMDVTLLPTSQSFMCLIPTY